MNPRGEEISVFELRADGQVIRTCDNCGNPLELHEFFSVTTNFVVQTIRHAILNSLPV